MALAVTLLVVAGLAVRTALAIQRMDLGFDTAEILTLQLDVPDPTYPTDAEVGLFYTELVARIGQLPGVAAAGVVGSLPIVGGSGVTTRVTIEGRGISTAADQPWAGRVVAGPDYPRVMNIPLLGTAMSSILYAVGAGDPPTYATVCLVLAAVALLASYVPARRAIKLDPLASLRLE